MTVLPEHSGDSPGPSTQQLEVVFPIWVHPKNRFTAQQGEASYSVPIKVVLIRRYPEGKWHILMVNYPDQLRDRISRSIKIAVADGLLAKLLADHHVSVEDVKGWSTWFQTKPMEEKPNAQYR